jgi:hypothetical protein
VLVLLERRLRLVLLRLKLLLLQGTIGRHGWTREPELLRPSDAVGSHGHDQGLLLRSSRLLHGLLWQPEVGRLLLRWSARTLLRRRPRPHGDLAGS